MGKTRKLPPLVFLSHDSRDAGLAKAFATLLQDASGGTLPCFCSSAQNDTNGIGFGDEWNRTIMLKLDAATDVVALFTARSLNRPWILFETGVAKGKLNKKAFGLALGIPLNVVSGGPFAQFHNCGDDEDSLTNLVLQLLKRNPDACPREEPVRRFVAEFRQTIAPLLATQEAPVEPEASRDTLLHVLKAQVDSLVEIDSAKAHAIRSLKEQVDSLAETVSAKDDVIRLLKAQVESLMDIANALVCQFRPLIGAEGALRLAQDAKQEIP